MAVATQALVSLLVTIAAIYDLRWRRIPNWLVFPGLLIGLALNTFLFEWAGLKSALLGILVATVIYFPLYLIRGMGAGDVKLMMAVGALAGYPRWLGIFITTAILGGVIALVLLALRGRFRKTLWNVGFMMQQMAHGRAPYANPELDVQSGKGLSLPHGAVIGLGTLVYLAIIRFNG
jgi:prepilin peptidase CpaA